MSYRPIFWFSMAMIIAFAASSFSAEPMGQGTKQRVHTGEEPVSSMSSVPLNGDLITDSPGEIIGWMQYDHQTIGSTGNRCSADTDGGVHFTWMKGIQYPGVRSVYYNYVDNDGDWPLPDGGIPIPLANGAGYVQIAMTYDNFAAVSYHESALDYVTYAVDQVPGFGIFVYFDPPDMLSHRCYWPYIAIDIGDRIHIVMREMRTSDNFGTLGYTRSGDDGISWSPLAPIDTLNTISQHITASPVSEKVAIVYTHPVGIENQWGNDVYYIESENGLYWDWENSKINITEYGQGGDSLYAYTDVGAVYDHDDNLHIIWNAWYATSERTYYPVWLYHYDNGSGTITQMAESEAPTCDPGAWNMPIAKMSIGVQENTNNLFAIYTYFPEGDCSAGGYSNGEIYMQYSYNGGTAWTAPENLTNSPTPGCQSGECDSDHWATLAERVDDYLHITYINDKDAGAVTQGEGSVTDNPVMYLAYPNPILSGCAYVEGDVNHNMIPLELDDVIAMIDNYRGILPPFYTCPCPPHGTYFPATADPNGNCVPFELNDAVMEIGAYMGNIAASGCVDCPGSRSIAPGGKDNIPVIPSLKTKVEYKPGSIVY